MMLTLKKGQARLYNQLKLNNNENKNEFQLIKGIRSFLNLLL